MTQPDPSPSPEHLTLPEAAVLPETAVLPDTTAVLLAAGRGGAWAAARRRSRRSAGSPWSRC
ncbi:hypothetical protein [Brachybacterium sp. GPGPB12]|uniref:hypothetical protein n=1 Tax=Brachybacterium sp. GPGPB12 TaxID=3023517 RepID=UPI0031342D19